MKTMKKILIVADLNSTIEQGKTILARSDFRVFSTRSGKEALLIHEAEKVDLIIADLESQDLRGDQLCSMIRADENLKKVSVIMLCRNRQDDLERIEECKANAVLTKPLAAKEFLSQVSRLLSVSERKSYRVLIRITVDGKFKNEPFFCTSRNLSSSGILIETVKTLDKGDAIACSFFLPQSRQILAHGEVMRIIKDSGELHQYGVRFLALSPEDITALDEFIRARMPEQ